MYKIAKSRTIVKKRLSIFWVGLLHRCLSPWQAQAHTSGPGGIGLEGGARWKEPQWVHQSRRRRRGASSFSPCAASAEAWRPPASTVKPTYLGTTRQMYPTSKRTLNRLPTELRCRNSVDKHRPGIASRRQTCKKKKRNRACNVCTFRLSFQFCVPPLLVGQTSFS